MAMEAAETGATAAARTDVEYYIRSRTHNFLPSLVVCVHCVSPYTR